MIDEKRIKRFIEGAKEAFKEVDDPTFTFPMNILSAYELATSIEELLKAQEPRLLQIKEMAFLEIAVFIETNGDLEGKGTDLFLAIPYIYAVSQNMLGGYIAFIDCNTNVYDLQAIDYGKLWRCWTSRPTEEQRKAVKWE